MAVAVPPGLISLLVTYPGLPSWALPSRPDGLICINIEPCQDRDLGTAAASRRKIFNRHSSIFNRQLASASRVSALAAGKNQGPGIGAGGKREVLHNGQHAVE